MVEQEERRMNYGYRKNYHGVNYMQGLQKGFYYGQKRDPLVLKYNIGYPLPKRCPDCRKKRKEAKKREKKTDAVTSNTK